MKYRAKIEVSLKPGHTDPEGNTTQHLLKELGYAVAEVGVSKAYSIQLEAASPADAQASPMNTYDTKLGKYIQAMQLVPGKGYWVYVSKPCSIRW